MSIGQAEPIKVLLIVYECNPDWTSVPLVGYQYYRTLRQLVDVTLVTHERNRAALTKRHPHEKIHYIEESQSIKFAFNRIVEPITTFTGKTLWQLLAILSYPIYAQFNHRVNARFGDRVAAGEFDIVHALTPMMPRYPVKISQICEQHRVPFLLGPVNGGLPYPKGFRDVAAKELAYFSLFRFLGRHLIPDYKETYQRAQHILFGSSHTKSQVSDVLNLAEANLTLFYENGISQSFTAQAPQLKSPTDPVNLLFVGRLVPYKGADMLLEALAKAQPHRLSLTIVGDGPERQALENLTHQLGLQTQVRFTGWVSQQDILDYYAKADIFCFPSIREFGGAVVMEAMAAGLPCITIDHGGVGEYVTPETGFKVEPISK
ncbi:MAG: glycosyltransferase [Cyanobacteria bacterium J06632_22]